MLCSLIGSARKSSQVKYSIAFFVLFFVVGREMGYYFGNGKYFRNLRNRKKHNIYSPSRKKNKNKKQKNKCKEKRVAFHVE